MLDAEIKAQLAQYLELLENPILLKTSVGEDENSQKLLQFVEEIANMSDKISITKVNLEKVPSFQVSSLHHETGICFAGIPLGHEFTSLVLALLQVSGRNPKIGDNVRRQIEAIQSPCHFETYVSLTCHNCPDVVQALNIMSVLNPNISHTMIDGSMFQSEVEEKGIMAVPTIYLNGQIFSSGRITIETILAKLGNIVPEENLAEKEPFDVLVVGGGPAGASAAIYAARKGIRTGMVVDDFGGQVLDTLGIENFIGTKYTEGPALMASVEEHVNSYKVDVMKSQRAAKLVKKDLIEVTLESGTTLKSKTAIISTGASWRKIGIPGETAFKNKGVAYCPHCDGPLFAGKEIAVIGGGNSGIEAAIDLAGVVKHVTVLEFLPELKADRILQERLKTLPNITVLTNVQTTEITGDKTVDGITYINKQTEKTVHLDVKGVFILIGLVPNTAWLENTVDRNKVGEILTDKRGATNIPGVFAAGDCTDSAYKQIIISMGSGASSALGAFDYLIRNGS